MLYYSLQLSHTAIVKVEVHAGILDRVCYKMRASYVRIYIWHTRSNQELRHFTVPFDLQRPFSQNPEIRMKLYKTLGALLLIDRGKTTAIKSPAPRGTVLRREWGSLNAVERRSYIDAVLCMQNKPSNFPEGEVPGAISRFDDFIAVHANNTMSVHFSGLFLPWHREFVWLWEQALRDECGYEGYQPFWNWALWAQDLAGSPLFDGSETSLSGDGEYVDYGGYQFGGANLPHGTGGGCATSGPFQVSDAHDTYPRCQAVCEC